jgi:hypothetical protein
MMGATLVAGAWMAALLAADPPAPPPDEPPPDAELLLYLAEFADAEGKPIDPLDFARDPATTTPPAPAATNPSTETDETTEPPDR